jgi:ribA/ribD-fused uncharacterized protein
VEITAKRSFVGQRRMPEAKAECPQIPSESRFRIACLSASSTALSGANMSWEQVDGKGPRWVGDNLPNLPKELQYAQDLPPKVTDTHVFFFGYDRPEPECCLQQWYPSPFSADEKQFHTAEQYMMYHKALLMGDTEVADRIAATDTPAKAKQLGREVRNFQQKIWDDNCDRVVEEGNYAKFEQNEQLKTVLLGTGQRALVETSPNDRLWGIGFNSEDAEGNEDKWGQNKLGKALERARERLRKDKSNFMEDPVGVDALRRVLPEHRVL